MWGLEWKGVAPNTWQLLLATAGGVAVGASLMYLYTPTASDRLNVCTIVMMLLLLRDEIILFQVSSAGVLVYPFRVIC